MHVVIASHHRLPVEGYGGPQRVVVALVRGLAAHGHRVSVIAQPGTRLTEASKVIEVAPSILKNTGGAHSPFVAVRADRLHAPYPLEPGGKDVPFLLTLQGQWQP